MATLAPALAHSYLRPAALSGVGPGARMLVALAAALVHLGGLAGTTPQTLAPAGSSATGSGNGTAPTLPYLLLRAKEQDATYRAALSGAQAMRETLAQAKAQLLPSVGVSASSSQVQLDKAENNIRQPRMNYDSSSQALVLRQTLYRRAQFLQYDQARVQHSSADAEEARATQELATRLLSLYMDALFAQDVQAQIQVQIRTTEGQLNAARRFLANGQGTRIDVDEALARLDLAQAQAVQARQQVEYSLEQLRQAINFPLPGLARLDPQRVLPKLTNESLVHWMDRALEANPALEMARTRAQVARLEAAKTDAAHWPTVDLTLQRALSKSESTSNPLASYNTTQLGVQLNVPLFSGGYTQSTVRQALALSEREEFQMEQARRTLVLEVRKEYQGVSEGAVREVALRQALLSAEQLVASTEKGILAGSRTQTELLNALQRVSEVRRDLAQARYQYLLAWGKLQILSGEPAEGLFLQLDGLLVKD